MASVIICSDLGAPQKSKVWQCFHCFPIYFPWSDGTRCHDLSFLNVESFKPTFSLSSFTVIKRLFSSSSLSAIRVVSSVYLRLLIFLPAILIPACASPLIRCLKFQLTLVCSVLSPVRLLATQWCVASQTPLSTKILEQVAIYYWGDLPGPEIKP